MEKTSKKRLAKSKSYKRHYEKSVLVDAHTEDVFACADDHVRFSSHMTKSSWMMGGGRMSISVDKGRGQKVGSHIRMKGKAFRIKLFLDEVVTQYDPPRLKVWETIGDIRLFSHRPLPCEH